MRLSITLKVVGVLVLTAMGLLALVFLRSIPDAVAIARAFSTGRDDVHAAVAVWEGEGGASLEAIRTHLNRAYQSFTRAKEVAESTPFLPYIPIAKAALASAAALADAGIAYTDGAKTLAAVADDVRRLAERFADRTPASLTDGERAEAIMVFGQSLSGARTALDALAYGDRLLREVPCPPFAERYLAMRGPACDPEGRLGKDVLWLYRFHRLRSDVEAALGVGDALMGFLGGDRDRDVLLLFLNNMEIRPGGGFLGTYGIATIRRGALVGLTTDDVYNLDRRVEGSQRIEPPAPFRRAGIVTWWYLRDANWSPDFSQSSRTVLEFYRREGGSGDPEIVIGFTPTLASALLRLVGPVVINGVEFTAANIGDALEYEVEKAYDEKGISRAQRKSIITPLTTTIVDRLFHRPFREWRPVGDALASAIRERHLMTYARDDRLHALLDWFGLTGRVSPHLGRRDSLLVVDANLGALKTDPFVERSIRYTVRPDGDGYRGIVRLRYRNTATFTWRTTRYRTYTRVFLPPGTRLLSATGAMARDRSEERGLVDVGTELDRVVVGAFLSVEPGDERELTFVITIEPQLVDRIRNGSYGLFVQKQLGTIATPLTLDLDFGTPVRTAAPPEPPAAWGDTRYHIETDLREDREFNVQFDPRT